MTGCLIFFFFALLLLLLLLLLSTRTHRCRIALSGNAEASLGLGHKLTRIWHQDRGRKPCEQSRSIEFIGVGVERQVEGRVAANWETAGMNEFPTSSSGGVVLRVLCMYRAPMPEACYPPWEPG
jgi:hypothetical protein